MHRKTSKRYNYEHNQLFSVFRFAGNSDLLLSHKRLRPEKLISKSVKARTLFQKCRIDKTRHEQNRCTINHGRTLQT